MEREMTLGKKEERASGTPRGEFFILAIILPGLPRNRVPKTLASQILSWKSYSSKSMN
jgi:hypothetical protein